MAQRTVAICDGKYIGIESIYTVINGHQINIPNRLKDLREKSRNNKLFCPCGCGANLILVAGDKNLREQHFRIKDGTYNNNCTFKTEGRESVEAKIALKCWLDDKLGTLDIETRVPIYAIENNKRKYEFSFLSKERKIALSYCYDRRNLSDEKFDILEDNRKNIHLIYVVARMNEGSNGQYPEGLMKVQEKQGYCLLLSNSKGDYAKTKMRAVYYKTDIDGLWREITIASGLLRDFNINLDGTISYFGKSLSVLLKEVEQNFQKEMKKMILRRVEVVRKQVAYQEEQKRQEEKISEQKREYEKQRQLEAQRRAEDFKKNMESQFAQQETQVRDEEGNRWIKCEFCGMIAKEENFVSYGGQGRINLGICKECAKDHSAFEIEMRESVKTVNKKYDPTLCPECGGKLRERRGPYGKFWGCSNYPRCRYIRKGNIAGR